jgi:autotransporter-associated beta strand protein
VSGSGSLTNNGTGANTNGTSYIQIQYAIASSVTKVVQDSATSELRLRDAGSAFGSLEVRKGTVRCANAQAVSGPGPLGAGTVTLGNGTDTARVIHADNSSYTYTNSFILATGAGTNTIGIRGDTPSTYTATFTGGVTGNNNLTLDSATINPGDEKLTFSTGALNNSGTITHIGAGTGDLTINSVIGPNVTGVIQNSATSRMVLTGANTYTGDTTVSLGTLVLTNNARFAANSTVTIASGAKLQLDFTTTNVVAGLVTNGVSLSAGVYSSNNVAPFITGPGSLQVGSAGPSGSATITNSYNSGTSTLSLSWPAGQGWRLQQQTNSLSTGLSTNWVYVTDGSVSSTNILVNPANPTVFYRLTYP